MVLKMKARGREESIAYHEAGHAVLAVHYGRRLRSVTIKGADGYLGLCRSSIGFGREIEWDGMPDCGIESRKKLEFSWRVELPNGVLLREVGALIIATMIIRRQLI